MDATYKADLRELNELNFQRFDAKLEQRVAQLDAKLETGLAGLRTELQSVKASLLRWMFVTTFTIIGLVFAMRRL